MSSKLPTIFGFIGLISIIAGTSYYFMNNNDNKYSDNNYSTDYGANKGPQTNRVVFSNQKVNPEPSGLINNYFGGKHSKKRKYSKKNKSKKICKK
jgi:hypothetical protein